MNFSLQELRANLKDLKSKDLIYPSILFLLVAIIAIIFFLSTRFVTQNINKVFSNGSEEMIQALDLEAYQLTAKKLNIPLGVPKNGAIVSEEVTEASTSMTEETATSSLPTLDKQNLTITVLNSTTKKGVAGTLAQALEEAGYAKGTTGNEKKLHATTTLIIKEDKSAHALPLLEEIKKFYPNAIATTTTTGAFDVTIIIGAH